MKHCICVILILLKIIGITRTGTNLQKQQQNCEQYTSQLINVFNLMCDNIASEDELFLRDACVGCFTLASRSNNNQPTLSDINNCAQTYMTGTRYEECLPNIEAASQTLNGLCVAGYCAFVKCIRRINSDLLISRCYTAASADNPAELESEQIILYKNITSCILAMARCSTINPITGQRQTSTITTTTYNTWGKPVTTTVPIYNSLQINRAGDLRIIAFPGTTNIQTYFCATEFNLRDSTWMNYTC